MVKFELITRQTGDAEKDVPVLHVHLPTRGAGGTDVVVRKATEEDKVTFKDEYAAFLATQTKAEVPALPETPPEVPPETPPES